MPFYSSVAQTNELPIHFGQYFNNAQLNIAKGGSYSSLEFNIGNKRNQGNFGGIKTSYASLFFRIREQKGSFHALGLLFNNDREGSVIRRNRTYLAYARHQKLSKNWKLSAGISAGMYSFSIKSNPVMGGASSSTLDLNLGAYLYSNQTKIGFSINQLNEGEVQPIIQKIKLKKVYNLTAEHKLSVKENLLFIPSAFFRYSNLSHKELNSRYGASLNVLFSKLINIGYSLESKEGAYFFIGVHNITIGEVNKQSGFRKKIDLDFSYFRPNLNNTRTNINAFELMLKYYLDKN